MHKSQKGFTAVALILIIVVAAGGFITWRMFQNRQAEDTNTSSVNEPTQEEKNEEVEDFISLLLSNPITASTNLSAVDGSGSKGTAYRLYEDNTLKHVVVADMPDPESGSVYEGWLVQASPLKFFSTGVMEKNDQGKWVLEFTSKTEYPNHLKVVITEETIVDEIPEKHILEGDF
ncbi:hypothetical protein BH23PAT1_BH23PAT1_4200 [soil metagenome]